MDKIEKMFLDLNSVLVKFWIEQGRPDKETKIALLERMLGWYKTMGYITLDTLSEEPDKSLEEAATHYSEHTRFHWPNQVKPSYDAFRAGAEWQREQMMKEAVECYYGYVNNCTKVFLPEETLKGIKEGYVKIVILK